MIIPLIGASILSSFIYTKISFKNQIEFLISSYKKTLSFQKGKENDSEPIKESLIQMKTLFILIFKITIIITPFILIAIYIVLNKQSLQLVYFNILNNIIIIATTIISSMILKNGKQ